jgi:hypothetical protein
MEKTRERAHVDHFKEICTFFPEGDIKSGEAPDFTVPTEGGLLGIEHTEIFQPDTSTKENYLQAQDSLARKVVAKAKSLYLQSHTRPLLVQVLFNSNVTITKHEVGGLAQALVSLIDGASIDPGSTIVLKRTRGNRELFPHEIATVSIRSNVKDSRWEASSLGYPSTINEQQLQQKIDLKEAKLDRYVRKCSQLWLLIVADNVRIPSTVYLTPEASVHRYSSKFNRIFFFSNSSRSFVELQTFNF